MTKTLTKEGRERMKRRLADLMAQARDANATEAEAMTFAAIARRLADKHSISLEEIQRGAEPDAFAFGETEERAQVSPLDVGMCHGIAAYCGVSFFRARRRVGRGRLRARLRWFGFDGDVAFAVWLREMLTATAEREWKAYRKANGVSGARARASYMYGFGERVGDRLLAMARERVAETGTGRDLVVAKEAAVSTELAKRVGPLKEAAVAVQRGDTASYLSGSLAGGRASINRPVEGRGAAPKALR